MQLDEWIRVLPMSARRVATVDERHVHIGVIDQGVGERHAHPRTDDHLTALASPPALVAGGITSRSWDLRPYPDRSLTQETAIDVDEYLDRDGTADCAALARRVAEHVSTMIER